MFTNTYKDMTQLRSGVTSHVALARPGDITLIGERGALSHNIMAKAESMAYDYDLKQTWVQEQRWHNLVRQYVDPDRLDEFLETVAESGKHKKSQVALRSNEVEERKNGGRTSRRLGSCILGWTFNHTDQPTLTMHSRTSFLGYLADLDLALSYHIGKEIARVKDISVEDISLVWVLDAGQFLVDRSLAWWFQGDNQDLLNMENPSPLVAGTNKLLKRYKEQDDAGSLYADSSFHASLRPRKRWHSEVIGYDFAKKFEGGTKLKVSTAAIAYEPLPSVPVDSLSLWK